MFARNQKQKSSPWKLCARGMCADELRLGLRNTAVFVKKPSSQVSTLYKIKDILCNLYKTKRITLMWVHSHTQHKDVFFQNCMKRKGSIYYVSNATFTRSSRFHLSSHSSQPNTKYSRREKVIREMGRENWLLFGCKSLHVVMEPSRDVTCHHAS